MFFGAYQPFTGSFFYGGYGIKNINNITLTKLVVDEIKIDESLDVPYNIEREEWGFNTVLKGKFQGDLEAGNLENNSLVVEKIRIKRRKISELTWKILKDITFNKDRTLYELEDKFVEDGEIYEYSVSALTSNIEGKLNIASIEANYDNVFLMDSDTTIKLEYDNQYNDIEYISNDTLIETFGQYPIIISDNLNYRKSGMKYKIVSLSTIQGYKIDRQSEKKNRQFVMDFLNNKKPKIIKDANGMYYLVRILNPRLSPLNELSQQIMDVSFEWVEIANAQDLEQYAKNGLVYKAE